MLKMRPIQGTDIYECIKSGAVRLNFRGLDSLIRVNPEPNLVLYKIKSQILLIEALNTKLNTPQLKQKITVDVS